MQAKRITRMALLTAVALTIFMVEAQLPPLSPIPGIKLGLANIVTVWALFTLGPADALMILLARILLGGVFAGQLMTLIYSLSGGLLCYLVSLPLRRILTPKQIWVAGVCGAVAHNVGQLFAAMLVMKTGTVFLYFPWLLLSGLLTGAFTGLSAQYLQGHLAKLRFFRGNP